MGQSPEGVMRRHHPHVAATAAVLDLHPEVLRDDVVLFTPHVCVHCRPLNRYPKSLPGLSFASMEESFNCRHLVQLSTRSFKSKRVDLEAKNIFTTE
jgi:hypothetical protein